MFHLYNSLSAAFLRFQDAVVHRYFWWKRQKLVSLGRLDDQRDLCSDLRSGILLAVPSGQMEADESDRNSGKISRFIRKSLQIIRQVLLNTI